MYKIQKKPETGLAVLKFLDWAYHNGQALAEKLDYVPMPADVVTLVEKTWAAEVRAPGGKPVWQ
jgi:phosphate transport system substrate-binding protein